MFKINLTRKNKPQFDGKIYQIPSEGPGITVFRLDFNPNTNSYRIFNINSSEGSEIGKYDPYEMSEDIIIQNLNKGTEPPFRTYWEEYDYKNE